MCETPFCPHITSNNQHLSLTIQPVHPATNKIELPLNIITSHSRDFTNTICYQLDCSTVLDLYLLDAFPTIGSHHFQHASLY